MLKNYNCNIDNLHNFLANELRDTIIIPVLPFNLALHSFNDALRYFSFCYFFSFRSLPFSYAISFNLLRSFFTLEELFFLFCEDFFFSA